MKKPLLVLIFLLIMFTATLNAAPVKSVVILKSVFSLVQESLLVMFVFFLFSKSETFKNVFADKATPWDSAKTIILFAIIGIYGTTLGKYPTFVTQLHLSQVLSADQSSVLLRDCWQDCTVFFWAGSHNFPALLQPFSQV